MKPRWTVFEEQVRDIASHIYARPCEPQRIAGADIDGVVDIDARNKILIEITVNCTLEKIRTDITKLTNVRSSLSPSGMLVRCLVVIDREPTNAMIDGAEAVGMDVISHNQFAAQFIQYERYRSARLAYPFGSAVDPGTGFSDTTKYVPVKYAARASSKEYSPLDIAEMLIGAIMYLSEQDNGCIRVWTGRRSD